MRSESATARGPLEASRACWVSVAERIPSFLALARDGRFLYVNPAGRALLGEGGQSLEGQPVTAVLESVDRLREARLELSMEEIVLDGEAVTMVTAQAAQGQNAQGQNAQGQNAQGQNAQGQAAQGQTARAQAAPAQAAPAQAARSQAARGQAIQSRAAGGLAATDAEPMMSEDPFRLAFMSAAIAKTIVGLDRSFLQVNPAARRMFGYEEAELLGRSIDDITHPEDVASTRALFARLLEGGEDSATFEKRFLRKDGQVVWSLVTSTVVRGAGGEPLYLIGEAQDISEQKRALEALKESEERFRSLCTQAPVMLMSFDPEGRVRDVSDYWLQRMGYDREEIVGKEAWHLLAPESEDRLRKTIEENQRNRETVIRSFPLRAVCKDGSMIDLLSTCVEEVGDDGASKGSICVEIDLTDFQRAETALRESEERYRALVEHAPEAIMVLDVEMGLFVDANAHAETLFGRPREVLLTMGPMDLCSEHQADGRRSREVMAEEHRKVLAGGTAVFEYIHRDASGREIHCQTRLSRLPAAGRNLIRGTITDISELKRLEEKVRHAEKLAAVGALAAGVAHEIGNPLMALSMAAQSLERKACDEYSLRKLSLIREHIDRISRIVRQMGDLARPRSSRKAACDINRIIRRAIDMALYDKRSRDSTIYYELDDALPAVAAVEDELMQVCLNLALNAFDAMESNSEDRPRCLTIRSEALEAVLRVTFRDSGPGVSRDARTKLFEPFFTTKEPGRGTGLGLSVSYRILEEHGGTLRLDEDATEGAVFILELPLEERA